MFEKGYIPWNKGMKLSPEANLKKSILMTQLYRLGLRKPPMLGKKHTEEVKEIIRATSRGRPSWIKGKHHSDKTKMKMSHIHMGHKTSLETAQKIRLTHLNRPGERITPIHKRIRMSPEYSAWRRDVFVRDRFTCQQCGKSHTYIQAHHIKPFSKFPELIFNIDNGQTLCKECHRKTDTFGSRLQKGVSQCPQH